MEDICKNCINYGSFRNQGLKSPCAKCSHHYSSGFKPKDITKGK